MANGIKFSQLPVTPFLQGNEKLHVLQNNLNRMTTISALTGAVGAYAVKNTNLINTLSANLLTEIQENDTLISALSSIRLLSDNRLDTRIDQLSSWVDVEFNAFETQVDNDIEQIRSEIVAVSAGSGSPVFITSVDNTTGLEQIQYQPNTVPSDYIVTSVIVDDDQAIEVTMEWDGPATEWMGDAYINDQTVSTSEIARIGDTRRFRATKTIDLQGADTIEARVNAESYVVDVSKLGDGPTIVGVTFGPPPTVNGFTPAYYLDGDQVEVTVQFDTDDVSSVTLYDDASYATTGVTDLQISTTGSPPQATFTATINTPHSSITNLPLKISAKNSFGTQGLEHVSVNTIPCKIAPDITHVTYDVPPTINGFQAEYFLHGESVNVVVELDNANVDSINIVRDSNNLSLQQDTRNVNTFGTPPSASFIARVATDLMSITNQPGKFAAVTRSHVGVEYTSTETIPVKYGPDITNISISDIPTTGGYQPGFYLHGDPLNIVAEFDTANVIIVTGASTSYANNPPGVNVTTAGSPPSASFTTSVYATNWQLESKAVGLQALGSASGAGNVYVHDTQLPVKYAPEITNVSFGAYPGVQTELKDGDTIQMTVEYDTNAVSTTNIYGGSTYAGQNGQYTTPPVSLSATMNITIDTNVESPTNQSVRLRTTGTVNNAGPYHVSTATVTVNNIRPTFSGWGVNYPNTQTALKNGDQATVNLVVSNTGSTPTYTYSSPNGHLTIADVGVYNVTKNVTCNAVLGVNESTNNYTVTVNRRENNTNSTYSNVVFIADIAPVITIDSTQLMRSGGSAGTSAQQYTITARSDQYISYYDMDATTNAGSVGNWSNISQNRVWSSPMTVQDTHIKGTHPWVNVVATNRAGLTTSTIATNPNYTLAGFVQRSVTIPSLSRTVGIGTSVHDVSKLTASETFRGTITFDSTIPHGTTLDPSLDSGVDVTNKFTIVDSNNPNVVDYNGDTFFYLDRTAASNNVSGTSQLTIEETT